MATLFIGSCEGLHTEPNDAGEVPPGALCVAENVVVSRDGIIECRRGFEVVATGGDLLDGLGAYEGTLVAHNSTGGTGNILQSDVGVTTLTARTSSSNTTVPFRGASIQDRWIYATDLGLLAYEPGRSRAYTGVAAPALPLLTAVPGGSMQATDSQVAYRAVSTWIAGTAPRSMMSAPSGRATIANASGSDQDVAVSVKFVSIANIKANGTLQFYRSTASVGASVDPGDELGLVYERTSFPADSYTITNLSRDGSGVVTATTSAAHALQPGDVISHTGITDFPSGNKLILSAGASSFTYSEAGAVTSSATSKTATVEAVGFIDNVPDALVGAALYTNQSQEGIQQSNDVPPFVQGDVAEFRNCAFYGYAVEAQRYKFRVVSVGAPNGLQVGDTVTITRSGSAYRTITGASAESSSAFQVFTSGTVAENIANTARSLTRALTAYEVDARYTSSGSDVPGEITLIDTYPDGKDMVVAFSRPSAVITFGKSGFEATTWKNRVFYSKPNEPEAVPALNYFDVGSSDAAILRLVPLRDALIVLKEDGVYRVAGDGPWNFRVDPFDLTVKTVAQRTAATLENTVVVLTDQGVARISDTGIVVLSRPIEDQILPLIKQSMLGVVRSFAFGVGYDSARKYFLWMPTASTDTQAKRAFVYDLFTETWSTWEIAADAGVVNPADDRLYITQGDDILRERKDFATTDYRDASAATIPVEVEWLPKFGDRPDALHQFREVALLVGDAAWTTTARVGFATDLDTSMEYVTLPAATSGQFVRVSVPRTKQRGSRLRINFSQNETGKALQLKGLRVTYETAGERVRR